jgi:YVTN family beta-propeller protein
VQYLLLGPLKVIDGRREIAVAAGRERTLLILLLLERPRAIPVTAITDALWPDDPPASAAKIVQNYVLRLRRTLGSDAIETVSRAYAILRPEDEVDTELAVTLSRDAGDALQRSEPREAFRLSEDALALWRGEPLADVRDEPFAQSEIARLEELRLTTTEIGNEAQLQLGQHSRLVPDLERQVRDAPFRERLRGQLLLALYRSGRQADALAAYRDARDALDRQGLEPSRELRELERAVLNHDSDLELSTGSPVVATPRSRQRPRAVSAAIVIAGIVTLAVVGLELVRPVRTGATVSSLSADTAAEVDAHGHVHRQFATGRTPVAVALAGDAVWAASFDDRTVTRDDLGSGRVTVSGTPSTPTGIAGSARGVWVISSFDGTVERLALDGSGVLAVLRLRPGLTDVAAGARRVWVTNSSAGTLTTIDQTTNEVVATLHGLQAPTGVAVGGSLVWVAEQAARRIDGVDPSTGRVVTRIPLQLKSAELAYGSGSVWATNPDDATVTRVDLYTSTRQLIPVGRVPSHVSVGSDVWVTVDRDHSLVEIDADTGTVERRMQLANPAGTNGGRNITPGGLAASRTGAWISVQGY